MVEIRVCCSVKTPSADLCRQLGCGKSVPPLVRNLENIPAWIDRRFREAQASFVDNMQYHELKLTLPKIEQGRLSRGSIGMTAQMIAFNRHCAL